MINDVLIGKGLATGMFYHAPAGTPLPDYPSQELTEDWVKVGDVTDTGITLSTSKSTTNLKNWANKIKRIITTDHSETVQAPLMDTTEEVLKTVFGENNVTVIPKNDGHGKIVDVHLSSDDLPKEEAFLFIMKDGNAMCMVGTSRGQVTSIDNVTFAPNSAIVWNPTITAVGEDGWHLEEDDGDIE